MLEPGSTVIVGRNNSGKTSQPVGTVEKGPDAPLIVPIGIEFRERQSRPFYLSGSRLALARFTINSGSV